MGPRGPHYPCVPLGCHWGRKGSPCGSNGCPQGPMWALVGPFLSTLLQPIPQSPLLPVPFYSSQDLHLSTTVPLVSTHIASGPKPPREPMRFSVRTLGVQIVGPSGPSGFSPISLWEMLGSLEDPWGSSGGARWPGGPGQLSARSSRQVGLPPGGRICRQVVHPPGAPGRL